MPHKAACHLKKCAVLNDVKLFPTVYRRIYCRNFFFTLSNQTSRYKSKCIRITNMHGGESRGFVMIYRTENSNLSKS